MGGSKSLCAQRFVQHGVRPRTPPYSCSCSASRMFSHLVSGLGAARAWPVNSALRMQARRSIPYALTHFPHWSNGSRGLRKG